MWTHCLPVSEIFWRFGSFLNAHFLRNATVSEENVPILIIDLMFDKSYIF